ncbi:MAG: hypothetical protein RLO12_13965 [Fulvivirga sp.]
MSDTSDHNLTPLQGFHLLVVQHEGLWPSLVILALSGLTHIDNFDDVINIFPGDKNSNHRGKTFSFDKST